MYRLRTAAIAFVVIVVAAACAPRTAPTLAEDGQGDDNPGTWEEVDAIPDPVRYPAVVEWTGTHLLFWGGVTHSPEDRGYDYSLGYPPGYRGFFGDPVVDGIAYEPATQRWTAIPAAPTPFLGFDPTWAWTGSELLVWGPAWDDPGHRLGHPIGALYHPSTARWRPMAQQQRVRLGKGVWTGERLVVVGSDKEDRLTAAAYDPVADAWEPIPDPPVFITPGGALAWTGSDLLLGNADGSGAVHRWRPGNAAWHPSATSPFASRHASQFAWSGSHLLQIGGGTPESDMIPDEGGVAVYEPNADAWFVSSHPPAQLSGVVALGGEILFLFATRQQDSELESVIYDPVEDRWRAFPTAPVVPPAVVGDRTLWGLSRAEPNAGEPYRTAILYRYKF